LIPAHAWSRHSALERVAVVGIQPVVIRPGWHSAPRGGRHSARSVFRPPPSPGTDMMETDYPGRLVNAASIPSVYFRRHRASARLMTCYAVLPIYLPPPLIHAQNCASLHNGDVSYIHSSASNTILCEKNYGPAKRGRGASPNAPLFKYATGFLNLNLT